MSREFIVVHYQNGDPIIIFIDMISAITQHNNEVIIVSNHSASYCVAETLADIMRKLNTGHCRIVND